MMALERIITVELDISLQPQNDKGLPLFMTEQIIGLNIAPVLSINSCALLSHCNYTLHYFNTIMAVQLLDIYNSLIKNLFKHFTCLYYHICYTKYLDTPQVSFGHIHPPHFYPVLSLMSYRFPLFKLSLLS